VRKCRPRQHKLKTCRRSAGLHGNLAQPPQTPSAAFPTMAGLVKRAYGSELSQLSCSPTDRLTTCLHACAGHKDGSPRLEAVEEELLNRVVVERALQGGAKVAAR
jgi:hypothetical protein